MHTTQTERQAIDQVIENNISDHEKIIAFAKTWIKSRTTPFTAEDLKVAYLRSNEPVSNQNIYGGAFQTLSKSRLIIESGTAKATLKAAHGRLIRRWAVAGMQLSIAR